MRRDVYPFGPDWKGLVGFLLWGSALSAAMVTFILFVSLAGNSRFYAVLPAIYGLGAIAVARRWQGLEFPSSLEWLAGIFFGALPLVYGFFLFAER